MLLSTDVNHISLSMDAQDALALLEGLEELLVKGSEPLPVRPVALYGLLCQHRFDFIRQAQKAA